MKSEANSMIKKVINKIKITVKIMTIIIPDCPSNY